MRFTILVSDRKEVKAKLEELTGERAVYTRMPRCAFILRGIAIEKNGEVTTEEDADMELIGKLIEAGLISGPVEETGTADEPAETLETETGAEIEAAPSERQETEQEGIAAETDMEPEEPASEPETAPEGQGEPAAETAESDSRAVKPSISFPLDRHRPESVINLVNTIYAKGGLISKATGGSFSATQELVDELKEGHYIRTEDVAGLAGEDGGLTGISFKDGKVTFGGFPETADPVEVRAWTALAASINKACIKQKHVRASRTDETNEKFAFRTWLTRIGMNGPDLKEERGILYRNLSGHTAFRTEADAQKWAARQQEKREEYRRQKETAGRQEDGTERAEE